MKKENKYLVKYEGKEKRIMTGSGISLLQNSGAKVKIIKKLTEKDLTRLKMDDTDRYGIPLSTNLIVYSKAEFVGIGKNYQTKKLEIMGFNKFDTLLIRLTIWIFSKRKLTVNVARNSKITNQTLIK